MTELNFLQFQEIVDLDGDLPYIVRGNSPQSLLFQSFPINKDNPTIYMYQLILLLLVLERHNNIIIFHIPVWKINYHMKPLTTGSTSWRMTKKWEQSS